MTKHLRGIGIDSSISIYSSVVNFVCFSIRVAGGPVLIIMTLLLMQKDNNGLVMVNFYSSFINCTDPDAATVEQVAGNTMG